MPQAKWTFFKKYFPNESSHLPKKKPRTPLDNFSSQNEKRVIKITITRSGLRTHD
jgi:hypothetical protein